MLSFGLGGGLGACALGLLFAALAGFGLPPIVALSVSSISILVAIGMPTYEGIGSPWRVPMSWSSRLGPVAYPGAFSAVLSAGAFTESPSFSFIPLAFLVASGASPDEGFRIGVAFGLARVVLGLSVVSRAETAKVMPVLIWESWWSRLRRLRGAELAALSAAAVLVGF